MSARGRLESAQTVDGFATAEIQTGETGFHTDDFFLVLRGRLTIQLRDRDIELHEGEIFVVPRGVEHRPKADEEAHVLLIEPRGTVNTGDAGGELTAEEVEI